MFIFSILKTLKSSEPAVLCFITFLTLVPSCPHLRSEHFLQRTSGPTSSLLYFPCFLLHPTSEVSPFPPYFALVRPSFKTRLSKPRNRGVFCTLQARGEGGRSMATHTCAPAPGGKLGRGCVCLPTRSQNNFSVEPIRSKTSNSVGI